LDRRERLREWLSVQAANRGERVLFVSHASRDGFAARYRARSNWTVLHNGIDLSQFQPVTSFPAGRFPGELGIPDDAPVVTVVGRLGDGKGHTFAIDAWPDVLRRVPEARLLLVGDGPYEADLRAQAARLGLTRSGGSGSAPESSPDSADRVVFAGRRADVQALLAASTLACLPTRREALPTALIEAAACGVPAVASGVTGVLEVVDSGVTGLLVPYAETAPLAAAIADLLADEPRRAAMGQAARHLAEQRFDAQDWAARLHRIYDAALARRRGRSSSRAAAA
jgi:glycosyltransferase involved in cell wall biosynthesis